MRLLKCWDTIVKLCLHQVSINQLLNKSQISGGKELCVKALAKQGYKDETLSLQLQNTLKNKQVNKEQTGRLHMGL